MKIGRWFFPTLYHHLVEDKIEKPIYSFPVVVFQFIYKNKFNGIVHCTYVILIHVPYVRAFSMWIFVIEPEIR